MSLSFLKGNRTRYRNLLDKELEKAKNILQEDREEGEIKVILKNVNNCINRLNDFQQKLEDTNERLSKEVDGQEGEEEIADLIQGDWEYIATVMDCRDELVDLYRSLQEQESPRENSSSVTVTENRFDQMIQLTAQMQQVLIGQQQLQNQQITMAQSNNRQHCSARLPKLEIPSFSGEKLKWSEFWDSFNATIHKNSSISDIEKLNYLMSKLTGEARQSVSGIYLSNENYSVVVDLLKERYGDAQTVINTHYVELINLKPVPNTAKGLRSLYDQIEKHLRSLEALEQNVDQDIFIAMITSKIPKEAIIQLELQKGARNKWSVRELRELFNNYVSARERAEQNHGATKGETAEVSNKPKVSSAEALIVGTQAVGGKTEKALSVKCRFCDAHHWNDECSKYNTAEKRKQRLKGCCYKCLRQGHNANDCPKRVVCVHCNKRNHHHRSLCPQKFGIAAKEQANLAEEVESEAENAEEKGEDDDEELNTENSLISSGEMVLMQTAKADITNPNNSLKQKVRMLLDSGSQRSYITEALAKKMNLKMGKKEEIMLVTFGSDTPKRIKTPTTKLNIILKDGSTLKIRANVVPQIAGSIQRRPINLKSVENWEYLWTEFSLADDFPHVRETSSVELLIGNDYYLDIILPQKIEVQQGLYMLGSKLGWILSGRTSEAADNAEEPSMLILTYGTDVNRETTLVTHMDESLSLKPNLEDFWRLESIGIQESPTENDDKVAINRFKETLNYENGRYAVTWPWKRDRPDLPENHGLALGRLKSLVNRIKGNPDLAEKYAEIIEDQLKQGIIEKVRPDIQSSDTIKHYIPHHPVINPSKATTKVRIVYDASAKTRPENSSLNESMYRGPIMLQNLTGILFRFRMNEIAMVSDIEKAFLQIGLQDEAKDATRFLWLQNKAILETENNIQTYRFCRVPFGIISSPFLLAAVIDHHLHKYGTGIAENISENIYVDNVITGTKSIQEALELYNDSKKIFEGAAMNLRDWMSNSKEVLDMIPLYDQAANKKFMKILGLWWSVEEDTMAVTYHAGKNPILSKRTVLKQVASIYDPLGLFSPVTLRGKLFLQTLWNKNMSWDEHLSVQDKTQWDEINKDLAELSNCCFPRYIGLNQAGKIEYQLLVFCDASKNAYAAAVYLRQEINGKGCKVDLIFSKTRLVPNKQITIPRLELLAATIGARCIKFVQEELKVEISEKHLWVDSQCVLNWISSKKALGTFVENRVKEIKQDKDINLHYICTKENPADIASRGIGTQELQDKKLWWHGPKWLTKSKRDWPEWQPELTAKQKEEIQTETESEYRKTKVMFEAKLVAGEGPATGRNVESKTPYGIDIRRYSSLTKLLRVTALAERFVNNLKTKSNRSGPLDESEIDNAERLWTKYLQRDQYSDVIESIKWAKPNNLKTQLGIQMDTNGLLRCHGRLENAEICEGARQPVLLSKYSRYTELMIEMHHKKAFHTGVAQTLSLIRQKYWIPQGRSTVRKVLRACKICQKHEGGSYKMPLMPPLPTERVSTAAPFTNTGIDYFGPLYIKIKGDTQKAWVCLYTCLVTRAVHLELMQDMSAYQFLLGFRRFIAQHGKPTKVISDNASQFKLAADTVDKLWRDILLENDVVSYAANEKIQWKFIVELAPWMGGFYERLVGLVKRSLRKAIGKVCLTNEQLLTLLKEAEAVVNSRPLVYVGSDINSYVTLTPSHFLTLNPKIGLPTCNRDKILDNDYNPNVTSAERLLLTWKKGLKHLESFWKIWKNDYLLSLRERSQIKLKEARTKSPYKASVGDVTLIKEDLPRGAWRMGRIKELIQSRDGQVRSAKILLPNNKVIGRPINLLFPIECPTTVEAGEMTQGCDIEKTSKQSDDKTDLVKPKRDAAIKAQQRIKEQLRDN